MFDSSLWLGPLSTEKPSGESLRNDERFHELERLTQPRVEIARDDRNTPVARTEVPVDWPLVLRKSEDLRQQGRDLRLLVIVARALANEQGFAGLAEGLALIARTFELHWQTMHPELREGAPPREAALRRTNALNQIQNDKDGLLGDLFRKVFFSPRGVEPVSGRDLERGALDTRTVLNEAAPGLSAAEKAALAAAHDRLLSRVAVSCAAFGQQAPEEAQAMIAQARAAADALASLDRALGQQLGESAAGILPDLSRFLQRAIITLQRASPGRNAEKSAAAPVPAEDTALALPTAAAAALGQGAQAAALPARLTSRHEVEQCLDLIVAFYDSTEPSSPIPHLARRIKRMVTMDFMELLEDLAPSGLKEFRVLAGAGDTKKASQGTKVEQQ